ncbi:MAG: threonine/serine exporter family protein [Bacillota bacterium]
MASTKEIVVILLWTGRLLLENGAEITRVEDTLERMGLALGLKKVEVFATPTGFVVSGQNELGKVATMTERIRARELALHRILLVNQISRQVVEGELQFPELVQRLAEVENAPPDYPAWVMTGAGTLATGFFALMFGGDWRAALVACLGGLTVMLWRQLVAPLGPGRVITTFLAAVIGAITAVLVGRLWPTVATDKAIIGTIMLLVPGVAVTSAIIDVINEDLLSGVARGAEAILIATAVAAGVSLVLALG